MITYDEYKQLTQDQRNEIRDYIKDTYDIGDYISSHYSVTLKSSGNSECPICHHKEFHYWHDRNKVRCFSGQGCNDPEPLDIFGFIGKEKGISNFYDQLYEAINVLGVNISAVIGTIPTAKQTQGSPARSNPGAAAAQQPAQDQQQQPKKKYDPEGVKNFIRMAAAAMPGSAAETYMTRRGFDPDFLKEMRIGYDEYNNAVVIPYSKAPDSFFDYFAMRYIVPKKYIDESGKEKEIRFYKPTGETEPIFHADNITNGMPYVFVCEGQIDALSIEQVGGNAVAIGSTTNGSKLINYLRSLQEHPDYKDLRSKKTFVISFDHDDAGIPAEKKLIEELTAAGYVALSANDASLYDYTPALTEYEIDKMTREKEQGRVPKKLKDINELLQGDPDALTRRIERLISKPADVYRDSFSMGSFRSAYQKERETNSTQPFIQTGFSKLDEALDGGMRPALIFLGAITSIGKTTILMQIADYIAQQGKDVIVFALEMSRFELVSRSISRESLRIAKAQQIPQPNNALKFFEIADGEPLTKDKAAILKQAEDYYFTRIAPHLFIVEGEGDVTVESIRQQVQTHTELTGAAPVVIVDYLQLLQPPKDANRWSDKQVVDHNTIAMKHISRDFRTPVIGVLSLNRAAYNDDVSLSSGKESGAIEYGCDILLGMNQDRENDDGSRSIYIDILKNRSGKKDRRITFDYAPGFSSFKDKAVVRISKKKDSSESAQTEQIKKGERDSKGYMRI